MGTMRHHLLSVFLSLIFYANNLADAQLSDSRTRETNFYEGANLNRNRYDHRVVHPFHRVARPVPKPAYVRPYNSENDVQTSTTPTTISQNPSANRPVREYVTAGSSRPVFRPRPVVTNYSDQGNQQMPNKELEGGTYRPSHSYVRPHLASRPIPRPSPVGPLPSQVFTTRPEVEPRPSTVSVPDVTGQEMSYKEMEGNTYRPPYSSGRPHLASRPIPRPSYVVAETSPVTTTWTDEEPHPTTASVIDVTEQEVAYKELERSTYRPPYSSGRPHLASRPIPGPSYIGSETASVTTTWAETTTYPSVTRIPDLAEQQTPNRETYRPPYSYGRPHLASRPIPRPKSIGTETTPAPMTWAGSEPIENTDVPESRTTVDIVAQPFSTPSPLPEEIQTPVEDLTQTTDYQAVKRPVLNSRPESTGISSAQPEPFVSPENLNQVKVSTSEPAYSYGRIPPLQSRPTARTIQLVNEPEQTTSTSYVSVEPNYEIYETTEVSRPTFRPREYFDSYPTTEASISSEPAYSYGRSPLQPRPLPRPTARPIQVVNIPEQTTSTSYASVEPNQEVYGITKVPRPTFRPREYFDSTVETSTPQPEDNKSNDAHSKTDSSIVETHVSETTNERVTGKPTGSYMNSRYPTSHFPARPVPRPMPVFTTKTPESTPLPTTHDTVADYTYPEAVFTTEKATTYPPKVPSTIRPPVSTPGNKVAHRQPWNITPSPNYVTAQPPRPKTPFRPYNISKNTIVENPEPETGSTGIIGIPYDYDCTQANGFYALDNECDTYLECKNNIAMKYECPDGLYFNPEALWPEFPCAYPSEVRCEGKSIKQIATTAGECPRKNGYFALLDDVGCGRYVICQDGLPTVMHCPAGLVFNSEQSGCDWPENVPECKPSVFQGFSCPSEDEGPLDMIYKFRYGNSCREYIACQRGHPRLLSCDHGLAFDEESQTCIDHDFVRNCGA